MLCVLGFDSPAVHYLWEVNVLVSDVPESFYLDLDVLLSSYAPVYPEPFNWDATLAFMLADVVERRVVDDLLLALKADGGFREPVLLGVRSTGEDDFEVEVDSVVDGTHRVCASILAGERQVLVRRERPYTVEDAVFDSAEDALFLVSEVTFLGEPDSGVQDLLYNVLRSFKLNDSVWLTSDVSTGTKDGLSMSWDVLVDESMFALVDEKIFDLIESVGLNKADYSVRSFVEDMSDF